MAKWIIAIIVYIVIVLIWWWFMKKNKSVEKKVSATKVEKNWDKVMFKHGGVHCLDIEGGRYNSNGVQIVTWACRGADKDSQNWQVKDGFICSKWGKCFTALDDGRVVHTEKMNGLRQKWDIYSDGTIRMGDMCLTIKDGKIVLAKCENSSNQIFELVYN